MVPGRTNTVELKGVAMYIAGAALLGRHIVESKTAAKESVVGMAVGYSADLKVAAEHTTEVTVAGQGMAVLAAGRGTEASELEGVCIAVGLNGSDCTARPEIRASTPVHEGEAEHAIG